MDSDRTNGRRMDAADQEQPSSSSSATDRWRGDDGTGGSRDIAERAYGRFEARGFEHGHDVEDWLEAERELSETQRGTGDDE
jgi:hypothetical protein